MKKATNILKKLGSQVAMEAIGPRCIPYELYQPKMPVKLEKARKEK